MYGYSGYRKDSWTYTICRFRHDSAVTSVIQSDRVIRNTNLVPEAGVVRGRRVRYRGAATSVIQSERIETQNKFGARGRGRTGTAQKRRDFKSRVSTNFTTRAEYEGA